MISSNTQWIKRLCGLVVFLAAAEFVIATTGVQIRRLPPSTDFATYYLAGILTRQGVSPYQSDMLILEGKKIGLQHDQFPYLYPPPFALAMQPLARMSYERARQIWMVLGTLICLGTLWVAARVFRRFASDLALANPRVVWLVFAAWVPCLLNSTNLHNDIRAGSVGIFMLLAFLLLISALQQQKHFRAGLWLSVATLLKLTPLALIPYLGWRLGKRSVIWAGGILILTMVPALAHWGWDIVPGYITDGLLPHVGEEYSQPMNQSLDGLLSRTLVPSDIVRAPLNLPRLKMALSILTPVIILLLTLHTLKRRRPRKFWPLELGLAVLAIMLIMKITWVHTLTAMLFVWPLWMLAIWRAAELELPWARSIGVLSCLGFFMSAAHIPVLWQFLRQGWWTPWISIHVIGVLLLWGLGRFLLQHSEDLDEATSTRA